MSVLHWLQDHPGWWSVSEIDRARPPGSTTAQGVLETLYSRRLVERRYRDRRLGWREWSAAR